MVSDNARRLRVRSHFGFGELPVTLARLVDPCKRCVSSCMNVWARSRRVASTTTGKQGGAFQKDMKRRAVLGAESSPTGQDPASMLGHSLQGLFLSPFKCRGKSRRCHMRFDPARRSLFIVHLDCRDSIDGFGARLFTSECNSKQTPFIHALLGTVHCR